MTISPMLRRCLIGAALSLFVPFAGTGHAGTGDCCEANNTPGCQDDDCEQAVCALDAFCCAVIWDALCAQQAKLVCDLCQVGFGDCCQANATPGCMIASCEDAVCALDPFCCVIAWDAICAEVAGELCPACSNLPAGDCCKANATPGCDDPECEALVCRVDPFCCEEAWDDPCAQAAAQACPQCIPEPVCPGQGPCCEPNATPGCDDAACCESVCAQDPFCCDSQWDDACTEAATRVCEVCLPPPGCPEDLDGDGVVASDDLNTLLFAFGSDAAGDVDGDRDTDSTDLNLLLFAFGEPCEG